MSILSIIAGATLTVFSDPEARNRAAHELIRPAEVQHLVRVVPGNRLPMGHSSAAAVASVLQDLLQSGRVAYRADSQSDLWRSPRATLFRGSGDCEDLSIIAISMIHRTYSKTALAIGSVWVPESGEWAGHAWVEGNDEQGGFMIEGTTGNLIRDNRPWSYRIDYFVGVAAKPITA